MSSEIMTAVVMKVDNNDFGSEGRCGRTDGSNIYMDDNFSVGDNSDGRWCWR